MKKSYIILAALCLAASAHATKPGNNGEGNGGCGVGQQTNGCGGTTTPGAGGNSDATGVGIGVGIGYGGEGGSAAVIGSGNSSVKTEQTATGGGGGSATSSANGGGGGSASAAGGQGSGNSTSIKVDAPVIPKPASNTAYAPDVPTTAKSCRLFIGAGATSRDGSGSGLIPIGNDQTCLSVTSVQLMIEVNGAMRRAGEPAPFGVQDVLSATCKIEGMKETIAACNK